MRIKPHKTNNLFFIILMCSLLLFFYACDAQKGSVTNVQGQGSETSSAKTSSGVGPAASVPPTSGPTGKESVQNIAKTGSTNPPIITKFQLTPELINNVDSLRVVAEGSGGEGEVTFKYEWTKNGEPAGDTSTFTGFKRGDRISVKVTPYDGKLYGSSRTVTTEIANLPPKILEHKDLLSTSKIFSYQVKAADPDGDTLMYSLKAAPQGMTIDPSKGLITWNVPADYVGKAPVTVSVTDGHGGEAFQTFSVDVKTETKRP